MAFQDILFSVAIIFVGNVFGDITVGITHWGDVRSHVEPMQKNNLPQNCIYPNGECVGGIPQLMAYIDDTEKSYFTGVNYKLRFATGNLVSGETGYLSVPDFGSRGGNTSYAEDGWQTFGKFLNYIEYANESKPENNTKTYFYKPNYMSLGIKEFESGLKPLEKYLRAANTSTIVSNGKNWTQPFQNLISTYKIITLGSIKIGIVGFVNSLANQLADAGSVTFSDPAIDIAELIKQQSDLRDLKTIIAVGSGNYKMAQSIISKSTNVKLVIYGGGTKDLTGNYPAKEGRGHIATVGLTNGVATKLGALTLKLNDGGELVSISGKMIELLTKTIPQDPIALAGIQQLIDFSSASNELTEAVVTIDGESCWHNECNLGNLMTDAMVHCAHNHDDTKVIQHHNFISIWHGGAFYRDRVNATERIKVLDVHKWLPYHNQAYLVQMNGKTLRGMFVNSATALQGNPAWGQFLQVSSGVEVTYNNKKLHRVRTIHHREGIPRLQDIEDNSVYTVIIPSIIYKGKSVFTNFPEDLLNLPNNQKYISLGFDDDCLVKYLNTTQKITMGFEERIFLETNNGGSYECHKKTGLTVFLTLFITALIIGGGYVTWRFYIEPRRANNNFCF